jgi:hypothetical protein
LNHWRWLLVTMGTTAALLTGLAAADMALQRSAEFRRRVYQPELEEKICALVAHADPPPRVIVAGDSRAERQVDPMRLGERLSVDAANVAVAATDLPQVYSALSRHGVLEGRPLLVISVSSFQVNDGAIDRDSVSLPALMRMRWIDQVRLFREALPEMVYRKFREFGSSPPTCEGRPVEEGGFLGVDGEPPALDVAAAAALADRHPWYRGLRLEGLKWGGFQSALADLASTGSTIVLYNPPGMPSWIRLTRGTAIDAAERQWSKALGEETARYDNVWSIDFYGEPPAALTDRHYYDIQHLNREGAALFTDALAERLERLGIAPRR